MFTTQIMAQVGEARRDFSVGVNGGYILNKVSFDPSIKQNYKGGITMGFSTRYTCEKYFKMLCALQCEVNYSQMGWKENIETSEDTYERTMNYVQIPLLANLGYGKERGGVKGYLVLGPQIGFCLSEREKRGGPWADDDLSGMNEEQLRNYYLNLHRPNNVTDQYGKSVEKKFEYGLTGGLGMDLSTRNGHHFMIEGRYYYALSDIFGNSKKDTFGRSANGAIIAKLSYMFDLVKTRKE